MQLELNAALGRIFRITHINNVPWILANGLHCKSANAALDPSFVTIGNQELIDRRTFRPVPAHPFGTLADYVPFYFTPHTPMMLNIKTGYGGITVRKNEDIVILVSSVPRLVERGIVFVFTDRHAYLASARFFSAPADLAVIDWQILSRRDFSRDPNDPGKMERYQAEALPHRHLPADALAGIVCYSAAARGKLDGMIRAAGVEIETAVRPGWYF